MCDCVRHYADVGPCTCKCSEHASLREYAASFSNRDLDVIHDMRPDLLRQWIVEKMLDNGAITEFMQPEQIPIWANHMETYIREGHKKEDENAEIP